MKKVEVRKATCVLVMLSALLVFPFVCFSQGPDAPGMSSPVVVLISMESFPTEYWKDAEQRIRAELIFAGFQVVMISEFQSNNSDRYRGLQSTVLQNNACCALRLRRTSSSSELTLDFFMSGPQNEDVLYKEIPLTPSSGSDAAELIALRVVETIHTHFYDRIHTCSREEVNPNTNNGSSSELEDDKLDQFEDRPKRVLVTVSPTGIQPLKVHKDREQTNFRLGSEGVVLWAYGGAGMMAAVKLDGDFPFSQSLALKGDAVVSVLSQGIERGTAHASINVFAARLWLLWEFQTTGVFHPSLGAGAGVIFLWSTGETAHEYKGATRHFTSFYFGLVGQLDLALSRYVWLRSGINVGHSLPKGQIYFDGVSVATFGSVLVEGNLGLVVNFY